MKDGIITTSYKLSALKPMPNVGYTTRRHLLLDLDNTTRYKATSLAKIIMQQYHKVGDCLLVLSSKGNDTIQLKYSRYGRPYIKVDRDNYHLIFDNGIGYNLSCKICETLAGLGILNKDYVKIRQFRGDMTLRVSPCILQDRIKPLPEPIDLIPNNYTWRHDGFIMVYAYQLWIMHQLYDKSSSFAPFLMRQISPHVLSRYSIHNT